MMSDLTVEKVRDIVREECQDRIEELEEENKRLKAEIENKKRSEVEEKNISRRGFLKKLGAGAIGLGALSVSPVASRLRVTDNDVLFDGNPAFLNLSGSNSMNSDLDMGDYNINNLADPTSAQDATTRSWVNSNLFSGSHSDLSNINSNDHHTRYSDSEAVSAIESNTLTDLDIEESRPSLKLIDSDTGDRKRLWMELHGYEIRFIPQDDTNGAYWGDRLHYDFFSRRWNFRTGLDVGGNKVWHAGNDGAGSGLDADTVDGQQLSEIGTSSSEIKKKALAYDLI